MRFHIRYILLRTHIVRIEGLVIVDRLFGRHMIEYVVYSTSKRMGSSLDHFKGMILYKWFRATPRCDMRVEDGPRGGHARDETRITRSAPSLVLLRSWVAP
ncbi:hypothetical protein Tco_0962045 [Tanacetum coccineum]